MSAPNQDSAPIWIYCIFVPVVLFGMACAFVLFVLAFKFVWMLLP